MSACWVPKLAAALPHTLLRFCFARYALKLATDTLIVYNILKASPAPPLGGISMCWQNNYEILGSKEKSGNKSEYEHVSRFMREEKEIKRSCRKEWKEQKNNFRKKFIWKAQTVGKVPNGTTSGIDKNRIKDILLLSILSSVKEISISCFILYFLIIFLS